MNKLNNIWAKILNNGVHDGLDFDQVMRLRISNAISMVGSFFAFIYCIYLALNYQYRLAFNDILFITNLMLLYLLNYLGYNKTGTILTIISVPLMLLYVNYEYGKISTDYFFYSCIVLGFYFFKKRINQIFISVYFIALIFLTKYLEIIIVPKEFALDIAPYVYISNTIMSLSLLFLSIWLFITEHNNYRTEIDSKNQQLNVALEITKQKKEQVNLMLKELNHRVKNNLQQISSVLKIETVNSLNSETKEVLKKTRNRVYALSIIYKKLYNSSFNKRVSLKEYLYELIQNISDSYDMNNDSFEIDMAEFVLDMQDCINIGLIINELITNSIKYSGKVSNELKLSININIFKNQAISILFKDNGKGFFDLPKEGSNGLKLIKLLLTKNEGTLNLLNQNGACIEILYPVKNGF